MRSLGSIAIAAAVCLGLVACEKRNGNQVARAEVRKVTENTFEILPTEGQMPYCLVFTRSDTGIIRQLTMTHENKSVRCEAGKAVGGVRFRIPVDEGAVKVHVFFSDQKLNAGSIAQQLYEEKANPSFHPMDLRLPGNVVVQSLDFQPQQPSEPAMVGGVIGESGEVAPGADGGAGGADAGAANGDAGTMGGEIGADAGAAVQP